ncbi:hypothetical protein WR25_27209 [Diploscapter pachys]|uniref:Uncharacterized protein n=1 Tax=Diploscapter pachys TaxID=2018661 RepID=A0A2A2JWF6_9BILA|nr:hypothetical protein WR25_27209 [Diploscapter pachys]
MLAVEQSGQVGGVAPVFGADWETMFAIGDDLIALDRDVAVGERGVERIAEHGEQDRAAPVDVEDAGVFAVLPAREDVVPPYVAAASDAHMVGDDIDDQPHVARLERGDEAAEGVLAAEFRIDRRGVDDVVAVHRPGCRGGDRRGVDVADAEPVEIGDQRLGVGECEALMELQAIGGAGAHAGLLCERMAVRRATSGRASSASVVSGMRRRQLGCSSVVPGRLGCSSIPTRSSSGTMVSGQGACAVKASAASIAGAASCGTGPLATPACVAAVHSAFFSPMRRRRSLGSSLSLRFSLCAQVMSCPVHQPASVAVSCVPVIATAQASHALEGVKLFASRSKGRTRMP